MFKVPDWAEDIPKIKAEFAKVLKSNKLTSKVTKNTPKNQPAQKKKIKNTKNRYVNPKSGLRSKHFISNVTVNTMQLKPDKTINEFKSKNYLVNKTTDQKRIDKPRKLIKTPNNISNGTSKKNKQKVVKKTKINFKPKINNNTIKSTVKRKHNDEGDAVRNTMALLKKCKEESTLQSKSNSNCSDLGNNKKNCSESNSYEISDLDLDNPDEMLLRVKKKKLNDKFANEDRSEVLSFREDKKKEKFRKMLSEHRNSYKVKDNKLRERMLEKLKAAQFRYLNEKLYTSTGTEAQQLFESDPDAFNTYHKGYQQQVKKWPVSPLDVVVKQIMKLPKSHVIADLGCGEAALARRVPHAVRSFDLVSTSPHVEACDMAHTPLADGSIDVAVYCLALMGTGLTQYLLEANRILKQGGLLLIAEVESRFTDADAFARDVERLGFKLKLLDRRHKLFYFLQFVKRNAPGKRVKRPTIELKPCFYKKR